MAVDPRLALLESLLSGNELDAAGLDAFLAPHDIDEDLHLEFKTGIAGPKYDPPAVLREYVSAFANSDGGVLMVGVQDKTKAITGCNVQGGSPLKEWATRCLAPVAPYLSPPPRISVVSHASGEVLVVAVARALSLVPCVEKTRLTYRVRIGDATLEAPEYLLSDLMLGRRQHPRFAVLDARIASARHITYAHDAVWRGQLEFNLLNDGLAWADGFIAGVVCWGPGADGPQLSPQLLSYLEVVSPSEFMQIAQLVHFGDFASTHHQPTYPLVPFTRRGVRLSGDLFLPSPGLPWEACFAVYAMAKDSPPQWWQFRVSNTGPLARWSVEVEPRARPFVGWKKLPA